MLLYGEIRSRSQIFVIFVYFGQLLKNEEVDSLYGPQDDKGKLRVTFYLVLFGMLSEFYGIFHSVEDIPSRLWARRYTDFSAIQGLNSFIRVDDIIQRK